MDRLEYHLTLLTNSNLPGARAFDSSTVVNESDYWDAKTHADIMEVAHHQVFDAYEKERESHPEIQATWLAERWYRLDADNRRTLVEESTLAVDENGETHAG